MKSPEFAEERLKVADPEVQGLARARIEATMWTLMEMAAEKAEGKAEGRAEGRIEDRKDAILEILDARGVLLSEKDRARIQACADFGRLQIWFGRAIKANNSREVFDSPKPRMSLVSG